jgi:hypothetical protein
LFFRVYTLGGLETDVFWAPGNVLAVVGRGPLLFLCFHQAAAVSGDARPQVRCTRAPTSSARREGRREKVSEEIQIGHCSFTESGQRI